MILSSFKKFSFDCLDEKRDLNLWRIFINSTKGDKQKNNKKKYILKKKNKIQDDCIENENKSNCGIISFLLYISGL